VVWTLLADVAKRDPRTPWKALLSREAGSGLWFGRTLERREAYERMKPLSKGSGGRRPVNTVVLAGNGDARREWRTNQSTGRVHTTLWKVANLRRVALRRR
jgi:hypothetical protein